MPTIVVPCTGFRCRNWLKVPAPYHGGEALCALCRDKETRTAKNREDNERGRKYYEELKRKAHEDSMRRLRGEE